MTCARYRELISRYLDDEVTSRQRRELLAHVQHCHQCAAWLARLRQADVLLKGVPETRPSDRVKQTVLVTALKNREVQQRRKSQTPHDKQAPVGHLQSAGWRLYASGLLLRFEMQPQRVALVLSVAFFSILGLAYWANTIHPMWGYDKFGFLYPSENAHPAASTQTPLPAISSGVNGVGGAIAAPNVITVQPAAGEQDVSPTVPLRLLFDQPMNRSSVENALSVDPPAAGRFSWSADNEVSFTPSGDGLLDGITYTLSLSGTATSLAGTQISGPASWPFHTRSPYSVVPDIQPGTALAPTSTISLRFGGPMDAGTTERAISLRPSDSIADVPLTFAWNPDGTEVTVSPSTALPAGKTASLRVGATAETREGHALGKPAGFEYTVELPTPRLRLAGSKVALARSGVRVQIPYEALASPNTPLPGVGFDIYRFPGDRLSALSAQSRQWPSPLPGGLPAGLESVASVSADPVRESGLPALGTQAVPPLPAGTYLLVANAQSTAGVLSDWQLLIVADRSLSMTAGDIFWATDGTGRSWNGAEISLYSPEGALLDKGVTQEAGVWAPQHAEDASLAIARDLDGHLAALVPDGSTISTPPATLAATLQTDRPSYYPGGRVQFRLLLERDAPEQQSEQHVNVSLLNTDDQVVDALTLKPDASGGVTGLFDLGPDILPGAYTLRAALGDAQRDFPIKVNAPSYDALGVYVLPASVGEDATSITYTVSVLGPKGDPAVGAVLTGTLRIPGDSWASTPVTATTGAGGRAVISTGLPRWSEQYNEPSLYMNIEAAWQGSTGSDEVPLDLTSVRHLQTGYVEMVSPSMDIAAIAQPGKAGQTWLRLAAADGEAAGGDLLVVAVSKQGGRRAWALNIEEARSKGDATLVIPSDFAGGDLLVSRAGVIGARTIRLPDANDKISVSLAVPESAAPGLPVPVTVELRSAEGQGIDGEASLVWRRVSALDDDRSADSLSWEPSAKIEASTPSTVTLAAPYTPGLWFVECRASTPDGADLVRRAAVRVMPGPFVMMPPTITAVGDDTSFSLMVYNPGPDGLSGNIRANAGQGAEFLSENPQLIDISPGAFQRLTWRVKALQAGEGTLVFSMHPSGRAESDWRTRLLAQVAANASTTFASGALTGQQTVGVQVPTGMDSDVRLQVRASTSLLSALADAVIGVQDRTGVRSIDYWATILSAGPSVSSAYRRTNLDSPAGVTQSSAYRSLAIQEIYALQHNDGGWSEDSNLEAPSSPSETAAVLLALRRQKLASAEAYEDAEPEVDTTIQSRGLAYLSYSATREIGDLPTTAQLDERARSFYALSLYGDAHATEIRPLMAYLSGTASSMSQAGRAWLALALWQAGDLEDSLAVLDRIMTEQPQGAESAAPVLEALTVMSMTNRNGARLDEGGVNGQAPSRVSDWDLQRQYVQLLMGARRGAAWGTPNEADAIWALSRYAAEESNRPAGRPDVTLNDGILGVASEPDNPDTFTVEVSGGPLHAGTNWLKLQSFEGQPIYYSLTLKAER